jgi:hypothetical protein
VCKIELASSLRASYEVALISLLSLARKDEFAKFTIPGARTHGGTFDSREGKHAEGTNG